jgi:hypothetical protein
MELVDSCDISMGFLLISFHRIHIRDGWNDEKKAQKPKCSIQRTALVDLKKKKTKNHD